MITKNWPILLLLLVSLTAIAVWNFQLKRYRQALISSYQQCLAAGYPVLETYPPRCKTADGRVFVLPVSSPTAYKDQVRITQPLPDQLVSQSIDLAGEARGSWFFEASFPYRLEDDAGLLASGSVTALSDWMTADYVPFSLRIQFPQPRSTRGSLILIKSNPSGLPQHSDRVVIPIKFN